MVSQSVSVTRKPVFSGERQFTVSVWLLTKSRPAKVLLVHHRKLGSWLQPGGHIEPAENPRQAAIREVKEETNLDISQQLKPSSQASEDALLLSVPRFIMEQPIPAHGDQPAHFHIDLEYVVILPEQTVTHQAEEAHDIGWFTLAQTKPLHLFANTRFILQKLLA